MSLFPVPVSGQQIPRGWFARLVRFMNSLVLRGDETYLSVKHTAEGTLIRPTNYLIEQLTKSGGTPRPAGTSPSIENAMLYPDWAQWPFISVSLNSETPLPYNGWLNLRGWWESNGYGLSELYLTINNSRKFTLSRFLAQASGIQDSFCFFIPLRKGSSILVSYTADTDHTLHVIDSIFFYDNSTP